MCGIAGIVVETPAELVSVGQRMLARLSHRGPDDFGWMSCRGRHTFRDDGPQAPSESDLILLHRRLSILDLSAAGRQPMASACGRYHISFNGEIYNYIELRDELIGHGHQFQTTTDTEVLLAAFQEWGVDALQRFVGMFAFAILDTERRRLLLARDFFGIKPLFYAITEQGMAFASEIKALLEVPGVGRTLNPQTAFWYLDCGLTDDGQETLIRGIQRLPAAHYAWIELDKPRSVTPQNYWRLDPNQRIDCSFSEARTQLREMFLESVAMHLRSDVAVGTALSGGIDSSSIVMAARRLSGQDLQFHSFSFLADDPRMNEEAWIRIVARQSRAQVHEIRIQPDELVEELDDLILAQDEPFGSTSVYAQYRVFRQVRAAGVKVMLDGQGADEILAGYKSFLLPRLNSLLGAGQTRQALLFYLRAMKDSDAGAFQLVVARLREHFPVALQRPLLGLLQRVFARVRGTRAHAARSRNTHPLLAESRLVSAAGSEQCLEHSLLWKHFAG